MPQISNENTRLFYYIMLEALLAVEPVRRFTIRTSAKYLSLFPSFNEIKSPPLSYRSDPRYES